LTPPPPPATSSIEEFIQKSQEDLNKRRLMLVNELDTADAEQRRELKRQKQLHKKLRKKKKRANTKPSKPSTINSDLVSTINTRNHQISQLTDRIKKTSTTMTVENKVANINIILGKIKKQQMELRKLRQHVLSMLNEESKSNSTNPNEQSLSNDQDILMKFLNQPMTSGCWLCSGKTFTEVASQCNNTDEQ
jgi:DNA repair exonuclease SbcCD ATPase subunit